MSHHTVQTPVAVPLRVRAREMLAIERIDVVAQALTISVWMVGKRTELPAIIVHEDLINSAAAAVKRDLAVVVNHC